MSGSPKHVFRIKAAWLSLAIVAIAGCREPLGKPTSIPNEKNSGLIAEPKVDIQPSAAPVFATTGSEGGESEVDTSDSPKRPIETPPLPAGEALGIADDIIPEDRLLAEPATGEAETEEILESYVGPDQRVRERMSPPPDVKPLGLDNHLWIDRQHGRVIADGYVTMRRGVLEMFACPMGTKEHEAVVATLAKSKEVHAALLSIGAVPGTPVQFMPKFVPATGQVIRVWVCWRDERGDFQAVDARQWITKVNSEKSMDAEWVFAGSGFWKDPSDGREYYQADGGDMICVSNFSTAMLDISIASSAESDQLMFQPATDMIPERGTPVRIVLVPIPDPIDAKDKESARRWLEETTSKKNDPPSDEILPPLKPLERDDDAIDENAPL